ncbi:hypothetical protein PG999_011796 [Apiospora kogelbergensis]|uniref:Uncharacterized protein n=1 Tax=Apiospora kogelbergensis TaxID=1337665 RepID=A0AAW0QFV3_9PEZI
MALSALQLAPVFAFPAKSVGAAKRGILDDSHFVVGLNRRTFDLQIREDKDKKEKEKKKDEIEIVGAFGTPVPLVGGKKKQDTAFKSTVGKFEVEFSAETARTLTVTENKTPGTPPKGFKLLEPSSFKVSFAEGGDKLTFGGIDYIFDPASLKGVDLSKSQVAKLDATTKAFIIDAKLGELEFEADENEVAFKKVKDLTGEWAVVIPDGTATPPANNGTAGGAAGGEKKKEKEKDDKAGQVEVAAVFGTANLVAPNAFTNLNFPKNAAGSLEVELNGTSANQVVVAPIMATLPPPAGHMYVDPLTFSRSPPAAGDTNKLDYIFTEGIKAAIDPSKGLPGKLDTATNTWVITGLGEFEFEQDENEWSLKVADVNGVWALFVPQAAVKAVV